jgi:hypothetical protein
MLVDSPEIVSSYSFLVEVLDTTSVASKHSFLLMMLSGGLFLGLVISFQNSYYSLTSVTKIFLATKLVFNYSML